MDEILVFTILEAILNFIGACFRWIFGTIWRTLMNKPKFTFKEYLDGPKKSSDFFDEFAHGTNNVIVGITFSAIIIILIVLITL
jgi:hypothetical protein